MEAILAGEESVVFQDSFEQSPSLAPIFDGVLLAYSPEPGDITLEWLAAIDDSTSPAAMQYRVYKGTESLAEDIGNGKPPDIKKKLKKILKKSLTPIPLRGQLYNY